MSARKAIAWIGVLAATHLAAFFAARHHEGKAPDGAAEVQVAGDSARGAKSAPRDRLSLRYAQVWQELLDTPMSRAEFELARDRLLMDWMKRDLGAVLDLLKGPEASGVFKSVEVSRAISAEIAKNPQPVLEWIHSGRFGSCRNDMFGWWYRALAEDGQLEGVVAALPQCTQYEQYEALRFLSDKSDEKRLASVRQALATWYREGAKRGQVVETYARRKAELLAGDTAALFAKETDPQIRLFLGEGWMEARMGRAPSASRLGELRELPEDAREQAVVKVMKIFGSDGIKGVAPALAEMNRQSMWSELAGEGVRQSVLLCARNREDQHKVLESVMALGDAGTRAKLLESAGRGMVLGGGAEPGYESVLSLVPQGADRDACLAGMVNALRERGDLGLAKRAFQGIAGSAMRADLLEKTPQLGE